MATKNIEFRVGVVIIIGVIILVGSLYWLQGYRLKTNMLSVQAVFRDVGTLAVGDKVTVSGVHKGKVSELRLSQRGVEVEMLLAKDVVLNRDARFVIKNMGLMGERFIAITPGVDSAGFDWDQIVIGEYDTGLPEVMGLMGDMITELRNLVVSFKRTIGSDSTLNKFNRTVGNLEAVSTSLAKYVDRNESKLDHTAENFLEASAKLNEIIAGNGFRVDSTMARVDRASASLERIVGQMDTVSLSAREFAENLNHPDGTIQLLLEDRRLYDDLRKTADNFDDLISDIRANPRKYINLTVEIF